MGWKWIMVAVLGLHGAIHLMGCSDIFGWAKFEGLRGPVWPGMTGAWLTVAGVAWLMAAAFLMASAIGLSLQREWWRTFAWIGILFSQVLIGLWWNDAKVGTLPNAVIAVTLWWSGDLQVL